MNIPSDLLRQIFTQQPTGIPNQTGSPSQSVPNLGMPMTPPQIPTAANPPQNPGKYMQQAMKLSGVPGLMGNPQPQAQGTPTGYVPRNILQWLQSGYGLPGSFGGSGFNLGMGMPFYF